MMGRIFSALRRASASLPEGHSGFEGSVGSVPMFGAMSSAGERVSPETVMNLSSVWACTTRTAQLVASLPAAIYARGAQDSRETVSHELAQILTVAPNRDQTAFEFWEGVVAQLLIRGNAPSEMLKIGNRVVGLRPLINATPDVRQGQLYRWSFMDRGKVEYLPPEKVFNIPGFSTGGGLGLSAVRAGVNSFGAALAADKTSSGFFANAMQPGAVVTWETNNGQAGPSPEQRGALKALLDKFTGSRRAGKTLVLPPQAKYEHITLSPEDAQLLETRRYAVEDICRWFGVPPVVIGHSAEGQTMWGTGVESIMLSWLTTGINPLLKRIEKRILKDLIPAPQRLSWYFEFNREAVLQMDSKSKATFMSMMGASGTMTANERRSLLNLPRSNDPNADALLAQTALAPLNLLGRSEE
jgi:HK97 family phage portal protein